MGSEGILSLLPIIVWIFSVMFILNYWCPLKPEQCDQN